jgi:hypothetical protein
MPTGENVQLFTLSLRSGWRTVAPINHSSPILTKSFDYLFAPMAKNAVTRDGVECSLVKTISSGRCIFLHRYLHRPSSAVRDRRNRKKRSRNKVARALD